MLKSAHFIGGKWISTEETFENEPVQGKSDKFSIGEFELVNEAAIEAERAFSNYSNITNSIFTHLNRLKIHFYELFHPWNLLNCYVNPA